MNELAIEHLVNSKYCYPSDKNSLNLRIRFDKKDKIDKVFVVFGVKYEFAKIQKECEMELKNTTRLFNFYEAVLKLSDTRLCYIFKIISNGKTYYFSEDGLTNSYNFSFNYYNAFNFGYINEVDIHKEVEWMKSAIFYQIFVDRYDIGNKIKDLSYKNMMINERPTPKSFYGGDLRGIINHLDYINDMGINAIYLTPIFKSISNHKYDIESYYEIDPMFGSESDLKELVNKAHELGMKIILDAVFNHISDRSSIFKDVILNGKKSKYYDWFIIRDLESKDYECFSSCKYMPKINTSNEEASNYLINVGKYYIEKFDIDGWRLDVSDEVSHYFWKKFNKEIKKIKPDAVLIGENWHDASDYLRGDEFDSIMNYAFLKSMLDYFKNEDYTSEDLSNKLNELLMRNTNIVNRMMLNLLDSHDTHRFFSEIDKNRDKMKAAYAILFMFLGAPCIYYGDEIYTEGGYDPDSRRAMNRDSKEKELINLIKRLSDLHKNLSDKDITIMNKNSLFIIERFDKNTKYSLILNKGDTVEISVNDVIISSNFSDNYLQNYGFVIISR